MRKKNIFAILLLITSIQVFAQQKIRFSIFANPTINWFSSDIKTVKSDAAGIGIDVGLTVDKFFAERYAFSSGISIGTYGSKLLYENGGTFNVHGSKIIVAPGSTVNYRMQYITIPFGLKFKTNEIGYLTYFAHLGLTTQFNINATGTSSDSKLDGDNIGEEVSFINMGYHFGLGAEYSLGGSTALVFGLTYTGGFLDVTSSNADKITLSNVAIRVGILF